METPDKASKSAHEAFDKIDSATSRAVEGHGDS
jgi:hypothetical protein